MKIPALDLDNILKEANLASHPAEAEDCSIVHISKTQALLSNIDIVTPIHDDPYMMGKIAACNTTNDLFALNARDVLTYNCFIGLPNDIPKEAAVGILMGMTDFLATMDAKIDGGHSIQNDVPLMGGATSSIIDLDSIIYKQGCKSGDRLILTKPLGIQSIMAAYRMLRSNPEYLEEIDTSRILKGISMAEKIMTTSNRQIPLLIHKNLSKFNKTTIHAMTDITGFGFTRHLEEMLTETGLGADINLLPVIPTTVDLEDIFCYRIDEGKCSEIAGAMLISIDNNIFSDFTQALSDDNIWWSEVGKITNNHTEVKYIDGFQLVETENY